MLWLCLKWSVISVSGDCVCSEEEQRGEEDVADASLLILSVPRERWLGDAWARAEG